MRKGQDRKKRCRARLRVGGKDPLWGELRMLNIEREQRSGGEKNSLSREKKTALARGGVHKGGVLGLVGVNIFMVGRNYPPKS